MNDRQLAFIAAYFKNGFNGTQAAISAGYSARTAVSMASRLLSNVKVQKKVEELKNKLSGQDNLKIKQIVDELVKVAFGNIADVLDFESGSLALKKDISRQHTAMLSSVSTSDTQFGVTKKFRMYDKLKALEILGRYIGMFDEKPDDKPDREAKSERILRVLQAISERRGQSK